MVQRAEAVGWPGLRVVDPAIAPPRRSGAAAEHEAMIEGCIAYDPVLDSGPVQFKVAERVDPRRLGWLAAVLYGFFCRRLPQWWPEHPRWLTVPPAPKAEMGVWDSFDAAAAACLTPQYQINVLPKNRAWGRRTTFAERACRPADTADRANHRRYLALRRMYGTGTAPAPALALRVDELRAAVCDVRRRVAALEERAEGEQHRATTTDLTSGG